MAKYKINMAGGFVHEYESEIDSSMAVAKKIQYGNLGDFYPLGGGVVVVKSQVVSIEKVG